MGTKSQALKLRIRAGEFEIEVEGQRADVDHVLEAWWAPALAKGRDAADPLSDSSLSKPRNLHSRRKAPIKTSKDAALEVQKGTIDLHKLATQIKEDANYAEYEKHIFHKRNQWRKIALILWKAGDTPLTSGQLKAVFDSLDVKMRMSNISDCLKKNSGKLISDRQRKRGSKPTYRLTSRGRAEFGESVKADVG